MDYLGINIGCVTGSLRDGKFPEKDCLLPLLSKVLGYLIVALSTTVKLPQILKILKHRSASGISATTFELEVVAATIGLGYSIQKGIPFSAYGEVFFILIQGLILVAITYYYSQPVGTATWIRALLYCAIAPTILAGQINPVLFETIYACQHITFLSARIPQIWKNFKNKSTGQLSFLTCLMSFGGAMVRVFTSIQEKAPTNVVMGSTMGALMNGIVLSQMILYRKPEDKKEKKDE
ncbi:hypothetical protein AB3S75_011333 [Citrus x aurantiifolia]